MKNQKPRRVYIAGKVTNLKANRYFITKHLWRTYVTAKFKIIEIWLVFMGYDPINPVDICNWNMTWDEAMHVCLKALTVSDYIYLSYDWRWSTGAKIEVHNAAKLNVPVINPNKLSNQIFKLYEKCEQ